VNHLLRTDCPKSCTTCPSRAVLTRSLSNSQAPVSTPVSLSVCPGLVSLSCLQGGCSTNLAIVDRPNAWNCDQHLTAPNTRPQSRPQAAAMPATYRVYARAFPAHRPSELAPQLIDFFVSEVKKEQKKPAVKRERELTTQLLSTLDSIHVVCLLCSILVIHT